MTHTPGFAGQPASLSYRHTANCNELPPHLCVKAHVFLPLSFSWMLRQCVRQPDFIRQYQKVGGLLREPLTITKTLNFDPVLLSLLPRHLKNICHLFDYQFHKSRLFSLKQWNFFSAPIISLPPFTSLEIYLVYSINKNLKHKYGLCNLLLKNEAMAHKCLWGYNVRFIL